MPLSYENYTGDNATTQFSIPFTYQDTNEISVTVDGVAETGLTFPSSSTVQLTSAPATGTVVQVRRTTDLSARAVDFASGSVLTEEDLDDSAIQVFHAAQETRELTDISPSLPLSGGTMTGDIVFSGTQVLQTANEILTEIKTVDGTGSGLDADTVDGVEASSFMLKSADSSLDMNGNNITDAYNVSIQNNLVHEGDTNTYLGFGTNTLNFYANGIRKMVIDPTSVDVTGTLSATALTGDGSGLTNLPASYSDSDVDTHLNTSTASASEVLSWNGSDYDWVVQSAGGSGDLLAANNLSDLDNAGTARTNLGVAIGSDVQAHSSVLDGTTASFTTVKDNKLTNIEDNATADQTGAEIKTAYEAELNTNAFTDTEKTKLTNIEDNATADQTGAEIKTAYEAELNTNAFTDAEKTKLTNIEELADVTDAANVEPLVDAHLNTSTASTNEVLSWTGTDYDWVAQSGGAGGGISNVVEDTTPQLGGNLDVNNQDIVSTSNGDIDLDPNGSGKVVFKGNATKGAGQFVLNCEQNSHGITIKGPPHSAAASYTLTLPDTDGSANEFLQTDGSGNLSWGASATSYSDSNVDAHLNKSTAATNEVLSWNGTDYDWVAQSGGSGGGAITLDNFTGDNTTTAFTITTDPNSADNLLVTINGLMQRPTTDYTVSGTTLTFTTAPFTGANISSRLVGDGTSSSGGGSSATVAATGGNTVVESGGYKIHTFTTSGTFTVTAGGTVEYLVVAGGGGGGAQHGAGGGAGGYRSNVSGENSGGGLTAEASMTVAAGSFTVTVGAGGAGATGGNSANNPRGTAGSNSVFNGITSLGGGGGGSWGTNRIGGSGGSGGGGSSSGSATGAGGSGTSGQGFDGGSTPANLTHGGGGGGGAGQQGADSTGTGSTNSQGGVGGDGVASAISGTTVYRGGGGGGGTYSGTANSSGGSGGGGTGGGSGNNNAGISAGTVNTGGGGGGSSTNVSGAAAGGSGVVIIRYAV